MIALFESIGVWELLIVGVGALVLFGKDLPKVAAEAGAQFTKLRRSLNSTLRESGLENEVRQIRDALPRDLSLKDVARTAGEKLAVRLEEEDRARQAKATADGPVPRGSTIDAPLPEPIEHAVAPTIDPASEFARARVTVDAPRTDDRPQSVEAPSASSEPSGASPRVLDPRAATDPDADGPPRPPTVRA